MRFCATKMSTADSPGEQIIIRRAEPADARQIAVLLAVLGYPASVEQTEQRIRTLSLEDSSVVWVAQFRDEIAGVLSFHLIPLFHANGGLGRITSLVVSPSHRRRGVGQLLVSAAEEHARTRGCLRMEVTSGDHRADAHAFYERAGFQMDCRRFVKHLSGD